MLEKFACGGLFVEDFQLLQEARTMMTESGQCEKYIKRSAMDMAEPSES